MEKDVQQKYRLYRWRNGRFYWQENNSQRQGAFRTSDRREAQTLLNAMNESQRQPILNLSLARTYIKRHGYSSDRLPNLPSNAEPLVRKKYQQNSADQQFARAALQVIITCYGSPNSRTYHQF